MEEDLDAFLVDHGSPCLVGVNPFLGILDQPDIDVSLGGSSAQSTMYALVVKTSVIVAFGIKYGTAITVNREAYTVREAEKLDDGAFTVLNISKT